MNQATSAPSGSPTSHAHTHTHTHNPADPCGHLHELSDFIDGELAPDLCAKLEQHMADCDNCRVVVDTLRRTVSLYRTLPADPDLPPDVEERLWRSFDMGELLPLARGE